MDIVQIVGLGLIVTFFIILIKRQKPELALPLSLVLGIIIFFMVLSKLEVVLTLFRDLADKAGLNQLYLNTLLKVIGIAYMTDFGAQICRDAGEGAVASKIELAGKVMIMVLAVPILALVLDTLVKLLPA